MKRLTIDTTEHQLLRQNLVKQIAGKGIKDELVLGAIANIPRHFFMRSDQEELAYLDKAFPIGEGQTISQPYTVAYQTQLLQVEPLHTVLEIGTGSGYQAAVLAEIGVKLFTVERLKKLYDRNLEFTYLRETFPNIRFFHGDGYEGLPQWAPFDRILFTAAAPHIPHKLVDQLANGGCMVLPVGEAGDFQTMIRVKKNERGQITEESFDLFSFVPMLKGKK